MPPATIERVVGKGPPSEKIDILIMGDGFTSADLGVFNTKVQEFVDGVFRIEPFKKLKSAFNVYRATVISKDAGIDNPDLNATKDTALNTSYKGGGATAIITTDGGAAVLDVINQADQTFGTNHSYGGQDYGAVIVLVNDTQYGGSSNNNHFYTTASIGSNGTYVNPNFVKITAHELGHSLAGLDDEYEYGYTIYTGSEPSAPNSTKETQRDLIKWKDLIQQRTRIPTLSKNGSCTVPDMSVSTLAGLPVGTVGLFEGGGTYCCSLFRPEGQCMMRWIDFPFCAVCNRALDNSIRNERGAKVEGCFIATAAFGSSMEPHVDFLRRFRDEIILQSRFKNVFAKILDLYYVFSPPIARKMDENRLLKIALKYGVVYPVILMAKITVHLFLVLTRIKRSLVAVK